MANPNELFTLHVDDHIFTLTRKTIEMYPNTLLVNVIDNKTTVDRVIRVGNDIYIDRDPKSFAYVVDYLRNYDINLDDIKDDYFRRKVVDDLDYFDLYCNYNSLDCEAKVGGTFGGTMGEAITQEEPLLDGNGGMSPEAMNDISTNPLFRVELTNDALDDSSLESIEIGEDGCASEGESDYETI